MSRAIRMRRPRWWLGYGEWWYAEFEQWDPDSWDEVWIPLASKGKGKGKGKPAAEGKGNSPGNASAVAGGKGKGKGKPAAEGKGNSPGNASAVTGGKGNAFSGQVLASKGKGLVWLLSGDGKGLASKGSASAVAGGKGNAAEGKGNAPGSASPGAYANHTQNHALCLRWARAVTDHWAPGKRQRTSTQASSPTYWTEVAQAELNHATECRRARDLAAMMDAWRSLGEMPLEEYEQLTRASQPVDSSSSSSYADSDQASWWEDGPEDQHDGAFELLQPDEEPTA